MSIKQHKPGENSQATLIRQGKHSKVKDKPLTATEINNRSADYGRKHIEPLQKAILQPIIDRAKSLVNIDMLKKELQLAADALDLSTKGTKAELVERINAD